MTLQMLTFCISDYFVVCNLRFEFELSLIILCRFCVRTYMVYNCTWYRVFVISLRRDICDVRNRSLIKSVKHEACGF